MNRSTLARLAALEARRGPAAPLVPPDPLPHMAPVYRPLYADLAAGGHTLYHLPGGRGSGKSSFAALTLVSGVMADPTGENCAIVLRLVAGTLRESVFAQIGWAIAKLGVEHLWRPSLSPLAYTCTANGGKILFRGLDDPAKLKSVKLRRGFFRYIWFEELAELPGEKLLRSVLQSVQRGGERSAVLGTFNPPISRNHWANRAVETPDPRALTLATNYTMVPPEWLGPDFLLEAQRLQAVNPTAYAHEYLGQPVGTGGEVFPNLEVRAIPDGEAAGLGYLFQGLDFGFAADPACFLRLAYDRKRETIYLLDEIYVRGWSNARLAQAIRGRGYHTDYVTADSAEPKSIGDLLDSGIHAKACYKAPGCVEYRVKWLQRRRIVIDPARTPNAHREFTGYAYDTDRDGNLLARLPDRDNHSIDAAAYALNHPIFSRGATA